MNEKESTTVRQNMMDDVHYRPYCASVIPGHPNYMSCSSPRMIWDLMLSQMKCPDCGWISEYPEDFIKRYKEKHSL